MSTTVDQAQIDIWKKQHISIAKFTLTDEKNNKKIVFVRRPTIKELDYASANLSRGAYNQYGITLFNICFLGGDKIEDEYLQLAAGKQMNDLIENIEVEVEKL